MSEEKSVWVLQITQESGTDWVTCYPTAELAEESAARYALAQAEDILSREEDARELVEELRSHIERGEYSAAYETWNETGTDGPRYVKVHEQPLHPAPFYPGSDE